MDTHAHARSHTHSHIHTRTRTYVHTRRSARCCCSAGSLSSMLRRSVPLRRSAQCFVDPLAAASYSSLLLMLVCSLLRCSARCCRVGPRAAASLRVLLRLCSLLRRAAASLRAAELLRELLRLSARYYISPSCCVALFAAASVCSFASAVALDARWCCRHRRRCRCCC